MNVFSKKVDLRSRSSMEGFLGGHFRYWTMNSWNRSSSYANCVKINSLQLSSVQVDRAWELLDCREVFDRLQSLLHDWAEEREWRWQAGFNGRSGGYLVLYQGRLDWEQARTAACDQCGRKTWHKQETPCGVSGCEGVLRVLDKPVPRIVTYPGRGLDADEDFASWDVESLRERVRLVRDFDRLCDEVVKAFVHFCDHFRVVEEEVMTPQTIKVLKAL